MCKKNKINKYLKTSKPTSVIPNHRSYTHTHIHTATCTTPSLASHVGYKHSYQLFWERLSPPVCMPVLLKVWVLQLYVYLRCFLKSVNCALLRQHPMSSCAHT